jgi:hypothetical protein
MIAEIETEQHIFVDIGYLIHSVITDLNDDVYSVL